MIVVSFWLYGIAAGMVFRQSLMAKNNEQQIE